MREKKIIEIGDMAAPCHGRFGVDLRACLKHWTSALKT